MEPLSRRHEQAGWPSVPSGSHRRSSTSQRSLPSAAESGSIRRPCSSNRSWSRACSRRLSQHASLDRSSMAGSNAFQAWTRLRPASLGGLARAVRGPRQGRDVKVAAVHCDQPDAGTHPKAPAATVEPARVEVVADAPGDRVCLPHRAGAQDDGELVPVQPDDQVALPYVGLQQARHLAEKPVAGRPFAPVIDHPEPVQVDVEQHVGAVGAGGLDRSCQFRLEAAPVRQAGQSVTRRLVA